MLRRIRVQRPIIRRCSPAQVSTVILCPGKASWVQGPIYIGPGGGGKSIWDANSPLFRILAVIFLLLLIWSHRLPDSIKAQQASKIVLQDLLCKAGASQALERWDQAASYYAQALALSGDVNRAEITEQIRWCRVQQAVKDRYLDGSLSAFAGKMSSKEASSLLSETMELVHDTYYKKIDAAERLASSLCYLEAAVQNKTFRGYFSLNQEGVGVLLEEILGVRRRFASTEALTVQEIIESLDSLVEPSLKAGLGGGWPALELSYAYANELDKYSYMLSPDQYEMLCDQLNGYYVGIGVELVFAGRFPTVFDVAANGPAAKKGLLPGDVLLRANSISLADKSIGEVGELLTGARETEVEIAFRRVDQEKIIKVKRGLVTSASVRYARLFGASDEIGYVRIASFDNDTSLELRGAVDELRVAGAKSLLIDLRCNGGGVMTAAIDAVRLFLRQGKIVTVYRTTGTKRYEAGGSFGVFEMPLALLVDKDTASAAEIFAAALQDHGRGVLIGQKTLGKGVVQTLYPMDHFPTGLCLTTATYVPPSDKSFNLEGIEPDILVKNPRGAEEKVVSIAVLMQEDDITMQAGLRYLQKLMVETKNSPD